MQEIQVGTSSLRPLAWKVSYQSRPCQVHVLPIPAWWEENAGERLAPEEPELSRRRLLPLRAERSEESAEAASAVGLAAPVPLLVQWYGFMAC